MAIKLPLFSYKPEKLQASYAFLFPIKIIAVKWVSFIFTESRSRDQLIQDAYSK